MLNAEQVALYLLGKGRETDERLSHLKLQKLIYFAQCATLADTGQPLFNEPILAWAHGPVVRSVYNKYTGSGSRPLPRTKPDGIPCLNNETKRRIDGVYTYFGQYSAWKLRDLTHEEADWETLHKSRRPYDNETLRTTYRMRWQEKVFMSTMTQDEWEEFFTPSLPSPKALAAAAAYAAKRQIVGANF
jgi:uncharacterized phage-associated protein